jgi:hypothetical protein
VRIAPERFAHTGAAGALGLRLGLRAERDSTKDERNGQFLKGQAKLRVVSHRLLGHALCICVRGGANGHRIGI